jgi:hypothetical protein
MQRPLYLIVFIEQNNRGIQSQEAVGLALQSPNKLFMGMAEKLVSKASIEKARQSIFDCPKMMLREGDGA